MDKLYQDGTKCPQIQNLEKITPEQPAEYIGKTYHYTRRKYHIVSMFEDCDECYFVVKTWNKYRKWWAYCIESFEMVESLMARKKNNGK